MFKILFKPKYQNLLKFKSENWLKSKIFKILVI